MLFVWFKLIYQLQLITDSINNLGINITNMNILTTLILADLQNIFVLCF